MESFHIGDILSITAECYLHTEDPKNPVSCPVKYQIIEKKGDKFLVEDEVMRDDECSHVMTHTCSGREPTNDQMLLYSVKYGSNNYEMMHHARFENSYEMMDARYREFFVYIDSIKNLSEGYNTKPAIKYSKTDNIKL
uniref:Uncharacterized protein n=1 Tax=Marseillevirus LCMAC101 TaxID=2506602 RepID=A0A481YSY1_9VIRU|nr:MAG: hypothetical protein LCMAC101_06060 [Marseillevirus LCMAC101]